MITTIIDGAKFCNCILVSTSRISMNLAGHINKLTGSSSYLHLIWGLLHASFNFTTLMSLQISFQIVTYIYSRNAGAQDYQLQLKRKCQNQQTHDVCMTLTYHNSSLHGRGHIPAPTRLRLVETILYNRGTTGGGEKLKMERKMSKKVKKRKRGKDNFFPPPEPTIHSTICY